MSFIEIMNLLLYLRKSRADREAELRGEGETLAKHRRILTQFAEKNGYRIIGTFEEIVSGERIVDRPEMQKLLHAVSEGYYDNQKIDGVLCIETDRLGRGNMIDQGIIQDTFKSTNTLIITPRKVYDLHDEFDEQFSELEMFLAKQELRIITRRLQSGRKESAREGKHVGKKPPYGYMRGEDLVLRPDPETSKIVKLIFEWTLKGDGQNSIAKRLTDMGVKSPSGKEQWERSAIGWMLHNEVYIGQIVWGKGQYKKRKDGGYKQKRQLDRSKWIIKENAHEPIVDRESFYKAQELVRSRPLPVPKEKTVTNPFASLIKCSQCGRTMRRQPGQGNRQTRILCDTHRCSTKSTSFNLVEERMIQTLKFVLSGMEVETSVEKLQAPSSVLELLEAKLASLKKDLETLYTQSRNLDDLLEQGVYSVEKYVARSNDLTARIKKLEEEISTTDIEVEGMKKRSEQKESIIPKITHVLENYDKLSAKDKNLLLRDIIDHATFSRSPESKKPDDFVLEVFLRV